MCWWKLSNKITIGRKTIYGNPYIAKPTEKLKGKTLLDYEKWLLAAANGESWAYDLYFNVTGIILPNNYKEKLIELVKSGKQMYCPGCKEFSCKDGVCHGSIILKIASNWCI